jgi:hypothetical protein
MSFLCRLLPVVMLAALVIRAEAGGLWVVVGSDGRRVISRDVSHWEKDKRLDEELCCVVFGAGKFVTVGRRILNSPDGRTWEASLAPAGLVGTIAYGNGRFIGGQENGLLVSTDGETFAPGGRLEWKGAVHPRRSACGDTEAGFRTVIIGDLDRAGDPVFWRGVTSDGTRWDHAESETAPARDVAYGSGHFVVVGPGGLIESSHDGEAWQRHEIGVPEDFDRVVWTGRRFLVSGGKVAWSSPDGLTWKPETFGIPGSLIWAREDGPAIAVSADGRLSISADFVSWKDAGTPPGPRWQAAAFGQP